VRRAGLGLRWLLVLAAMVVLAGCSRYRAALPPRSQPTAPFLPPAAAPAYPTNGAKQLVVGIDDLGTGFNSHLISDLSPVSTAVDALVLPSVFGPGQDGQPVLNTTVASSAKVISTAPFTVSYELNLAAAWSDNAPIAAEDFVYLWQRMRAEPGVVDNAGYRLITDVRSRAGGKAVDVVFSQPDAHWRELFSDLLPAHILKDALAGWRGALSDGVPVSGGPFEVSQVDRARGQLVLMRNDHYWATPSVLDSLILRRSDTTGMLDGLRGGDLPVVATWPDSMVLSALRDLGSSVRMQSVPEPVVVQLAMRTDHGVLTDVRVRQAIGALFNRDQLIAIGTGGGPGGVADNAQLLAPSEPGYHPTAPPGAPSTPDPALAARLLTSAGYAKDAQGDWTLLGGPLTVVIGAPTDRPRFTEIANEAQRELAAAGVSATVVTAPGSSLFTDPTVLPSQPAQLPVGSPLVTGPNTGGSDAASLVGPASLPVPRGAGQLPGLTPLGQHEANQTARPQPAQPPAPSVPTGVTVDLEVMPRAVGADPVITAVSNYGCPPGMAGVAQPARNPTGFCSPTLQPVLDAALAAGLSPDQASATIESTLWQQLPAIPLFQMVTTVASTPKGDKATGNIGPGPLGIGPFGTAVGWQPVAPR
jgi:ABC-type transport system substrate-binding protein